MNRVPNSTNICRRGTGNASFAPTVRRCLQDKNSRLGRTNPTAPLASENCLPNVARRAPGQSPEPVEPSSSHSKVKTTAGFVFEHLLFIHAHRRSQISPVSLQEFDSSEVLVSFITFWREMLLLTLRGFFERLRGRPPKAKMAIFPPKMKLKK